MQLNNRLLSLVSYGLVLTGVVLGVLGFVRAGSLFIAAGTAGVALKLRDFRRIDTSSRAVELPHSQSAMNGVTMGGKVTVVGAGFYGSTTALRLAEYDVFDTVVLTDILEGKSEGLALDMNQSRSIEGFETKIVGATTTVMKQQLIQM
ncbi:MAG: hypothetical protein RLZZ389_614 [Actinomycetota bacterium]